MHLTAAAIPAASAVAKSVMNFMVLEGIRCVELEVEAKWVERLSTQGAAPSVLMLSYEADHSHIRYLQ